MTKRPLRCPDCGGTVTLRETAMDLGPYECDDQFDCCWSDDNPPAYDDRPELADNDLDELLVSAVRYALGRATYIVAWTVGLLAEHEPWLSDRARQVLIRDVAAATERGRVGMDCDDKLWRSVLIALRGNCSEVRPSDPDSLEVTR